MYTQDNWEILEGVLNIVVGIIQYALLPIFIYNFVISIFGWVKRKQAPLGNDAVQHSFAIVVAAHNEENVVASIIKNLKKLNYPKNNYDIFIVADNCTDNTAKIAKEFEDVQVYERFNEKEKGKGFALAWMFGHLFNMERKYDAVAIFDADNLVSSNFLKEMNNQLCKGHKVVQGYLDSKNPNDTWVSGNYSISYWISNRLFQLPRYYLGLSCALGGTGFVMTTEVLKDIGWKATSLTEDLEFSLQLILKGMRVSWCHDAVIYDEKPLQIAQSWRQRKRWMQGQADCACRYLARLLGKAIRDKSMVALDSALYLLQPLVVVLSGVSLLVNIVKFLLFVDPSTLFNKETLLTLAATILVTYFSMLVVFLEGKHSAKVLEHSILFPVYGLTWIPIIIQGFIDRNKTEWCHTVHTRALDIHEVESFEQA